MGPGQSRSNQHLSHGQAVYEARPLSPRMAQTLTLLKCAYAEKEIANRLGISRHTVHVYVKALYRRFGVSSRAELLVAVLGRQESDADSHK